MNCSECNYACKRGTHSMYGMSADCDLVCTFDTKKDMYVNRHKVCKHFKEKGSPIDWSVKRRREYSVEEAQ